MRIAVEGLYATQGITDGGGRFLSNVLRALARRSDVVATAFVGDTTYDAVREISGLAGVVQLPSGTRPARLLSQHLRLPAAARRGADVLMCLGNYAPLGKGPPVVSVVQNLLIARHDPAYGRARAFYRHWSRSGLARRATELVAISAGMAGELESALKLPGGRVRVVHAGVDAAAFGAPASPPEHAPKSYVIAVGTIWSYRDYPLALDALAASGLPHTLAIAGGAPQPERRRLEEHARRLGLGDRLLLVGVLSQDDLRRWYAGADALLATSSLEAFPLSPLEAMAAGVPVVAAARSGYLETIGDGGLLAAPRAEPLGEALRRAVDPAERERLVRAGRARASEFSWERCAEGLVAACRAAAA